MSKRREQEQVHQKESFGRLLNKVYASLYNNVPWLAVAAICLYLPGIVLWAVFSLRCKADTFIFLTTIAPVAPETVDGVGNLVNTTLIALITTATFIFMLALVLAIARSVQKAGIAPHSVVACARPTPSSFYLYRVFNLGYNFIVFFVNMFIVFLMMGAFLWLVVAYGANLSIKGGVLGPASNGFRPQLQYDLARQNYTTVVSYYEAELKRTPPCVRNTTWFRNINSSIASILKPAADDSPGNTVLCPQSCLNLGSWATLFKLQSNCMCEQEKLYLLQQYSLAVATDAGVALGGLILIYFGSCCMHVYLISEHTRAGYDYKRAKRLASRRLAAGGNSSDNHRHGGDQGPGGNGTTGAGSGGGGGGGGGGGSFHDGSKDGANGAAAAHHIVAINGAGQDSSQHQYHNSQQQQYHQRHGSGSSVYESAGKSAVVESRGGSFSIAEEGQMLKQTGSVEPGLLPANATGSVAGAAAASALAAAAAAAAGYGSVTGPSSGGGAAFAADVSPFAAGSADPAAAAAVFQGSEALGAAQQQRRLQLQQHHHRISSGGGSSSSPASAASRQLQRIPSPPIAGRLAAAAAAGGGGVQNVHPSDVLHTVGSYPGGHRGHPSTGSRVGDWQQQQLLLQQQQQYSGHESIRATSPPAIVVSGPWSSHGRSESRSSTSSMRDLLSGAVPLDNYGSHHHRAVLTPTSSGHAGAALAAAAAAAAGAAAVVTGTAVATAVAAAPPLPNLATGLSRAPPSEVPAVDEKNQPVSAAVGVTSATAATGASAVGATSTTAAVAADVGAAAAGIATSGSGGRAAHHRRADSSQSNSSSSSSYATVVCHSPRSSSDTDNASSISQAVLQAPSTTAAPAAAGAAAAFLPAGSLGGRAQTHHHQQQQKQAATSAGQQHAALVSPAGAAAAAGAGVDGEVAVSPAAVFDGEEVLSGSRTGSWSRKQAHRRLPALDFTKAAPALWLAQEGLQQGVEEQQQQQADADKQQQQQVQEALASNEAAATATSQAPSPSAAAAGAASAGSLASAAAGLAGAAAAAAGVAAGVRGITRPPVRRTVVLDGSSTDREYVDAAAAGAPAEQQQHDRLHMSNLQQQQHHMSSSTHEQQQQSAIEGSQAPPHRSGTLPSVTAVAAMLAPSPEPQIEQQEQQLGEPLQESLGAAASADVGGPQQEQLLRQRPPYSLLLPPPEQQELLLKQQQQQLQQLLREAQEEQHVQQQVWGSQQRQWSAASSLSIGPVGSSTSSPGGLLLRQQQHHQHSYSTPDVATAAAAGAGAGLTTPHGGLHTPSKLRSSAAAAGGAVPWGAFGAVNRPPSASGFTGSYALPGPPPPQQQQQAGLMRAGSFSSSSTGAVRFAGGSSVNEEDNSSPGEGGGSFASFGDGSAAGGAGYGIAGSMQAAGGAGSQYSTPQPTPQGSPAPLRSGRVTPVYGQAAGVGGGSSSSWSQLPPLGQAGSGLTASSSYSGSANHPNFAGGLNNLLLPGAVWTPTPVLSPLAGDPAAHAAGVHGSGGVLLAPLQGPCGFGLNPGASSSGQQGLGGAPAIPPIPEITPGEVSEGEMHLEARSSMAASAAAAGGGSVGGHLLQSSSDVGLVSPLERRRSGYRSSMRKGLMAYDQYKHRQRYQETLTQPLDPGSEVARRYRSRMPAI